MSHCRDRFESIRLFCRSLFVHIRLVCRIRTEHRVGCLNLYVPLSKKRYIHGKRSIQETYTYEKKPANGMYIYKKRHIRVYIWINTNIHTHIKQPCSYALSDISALLAASEATLARSETDVSPRKETYKRDLQIRKETFKKKSIHQKRGRCALLDISAVRTASGASLARYKRALDVRKETCKRDLFLRNKRHVLIIGHVSFAGSIRSFFGSLCKNPTYSKRDL